MSGPKVPAYCLIRKFYCSQDSSYDTILPEAPVEDQNDSTGGSWYGRQSGHLRQGRLTPHGQGPGGLRRPCGVFRCEAGRHDASGDAHVFQGRAQGAGDRGGRQGHGRLRRVVRGIEPAGRRLLLMRNADFGMRNKQQNSTEVYQPRMVR